MEQDNRKRKKKSRFTLVWIILAELLIAALGLGLLLILNYGDGKDDKDEPQEEKVIFEVITEEPETEQQFFVPKPEISEQLLSINEYSRPGKKIDSLDKIVVHYLGNPKTTAQENHDYFESLKDLQNVSMSANYVIGLEGEIIHCVPDDEVAYASNRMNSYSISVENCHPDDSGRFTKDTYGSLVRLVAYLSEQYGLGRDDIIRHHDVTGKDCPKYFVDHEDAWERFLDDVMKYRADCKAAAAPKPKPETPKDHELSDFLKENAGDADNTRKG